MLKSKRYLRSRLIKLIIQLGDVILDSKLGKKLERKYRQREIEQTQKEKDIE